MAREYRKRDPLERFWEKVDRRGGDECWPWLAAIWGGGYGEFSYRHAPIYAHIWIYEQLRGAIPAGMHIDHVCHNRDVTCAGGRSCQHRRCVNPAHLEAVAPGENVRRGRAGAHNAVKTHCPQGHSYSGDNLVIETSGSRRCRVCRDENMRRFLARRGRP